MPRKNQARAANQELPDIKDGVSVCRVGVSRGGSQFEVWDGERTWLAGLPKRFRNTIWVRRGNYVLVDVGQDPPQGSATRGDIIFVLQKDHVTELKQRNSWPSALDESYESSQAEVPDEGSEALIRNEEETDDSDVDLFQNTNRRRS